MSLLDSPYFSLLQDRLGQLSQRQRLIAENIANAATPGFTPRDIDGRALARAAEQRAMGRGGVTVALTHPGHMAPGGARAGAAPVVTRPDTETTIDGNSVVLEDQMVRAAETRMAFESGLALYQKGLQLMRMAARPPGR